MHRLLGFTRDPFAPVCDDDLYWEDAARAAVRERLIEALLGGAGVWLDGAPGTGRETLLARAVEELALEGRPVLWAEEGMPDEAGAFLDRLLGIAGVAGLPGGSDDLERAAALYGALLDGFCRGGTVVLALGAPTGAGARAELEMLSELRIVRKPVVALALWGEGGPPVDGLLRVEMPGLSPAELRACLAHRAAACGRPGLLPETILDAVVSGAAGLGDALRRGREALVRLAFSGPSQADAAPQTRPPHAGPVLDWEELERVDRLLETLGPGDGPQTL